MELLEMVDLAFQNSKIDILSPTDVKPLLTLCVSVLESKNSENQSDQEKIIENFTRVGRTITQWLVRKFNEKEKSTTYANGRVYVSHNTRSIDLSRVISQINELIKVDSLSKFVPFFVDALQNYREILWVESSPFNKFLKDPTCYL